MKSNSIAMDQPKKYKMNKSRNIHESKLDKSTNKNKKKKMQMKDNYKHLIEVRYTTVDRFQRIIKKKKKKKKKKEVTVLNNNNYR